MKLARQIEEMIILNIQNETGQLEAVVLGIADSFLEVHQD